MYIVKLQEIPGIHADIVEESLGCCTTAKAIYTHYTLRPSSVNLEDFHMQ